MGLEAWCSVRMERCWYGQEQELVSTPPTLAALTRAVMPLRPWLTALSGQRKTLALFALSWLIPSTERCCELIQPPAMRCPAIRTTTLRIRGRRAHGFGH